MDWRVSAKWTRARVPWPPALLYVFVLVPRCIRDGVYGWVARNRLRLFGTNGGACRLPDSVVRRRMGRRLPPELLGEGGGDADEGTS